MAAIGNVVGEFKHSDYCIEFQKNEQQKIIGLYRPKEGKDEAYLIEGISEEILKEYLNRGDVPYIDQRRVHWIPKEKSDSEKASPPLSSSLGKTLSLSPQILRKNSDPIEMPLSPTQKHFIEDILEGFRQKKEVHRDLKTLLENPKYLEETFDLLNTILPSLSSQEFEKCVIYYLQKLLTRSKNLPKHQMELAHTISKRYLKEKNLKEAMRYSATAFNIAHEHNLKSAHIEEIQSQIFLTFLENQQDRIREELQEAKKDPAIFHQKLEELLTLKRYCREEESLEKIENLFQIAQEVKEPLNPATQEKLSSSSDLIMKGRTLKHSKDDWTFITKEYRKHLEEYRNTYKQEIPLLIREKQRIYTQKFQDFFNHLITDAFIILGPPPCAYTFCSMGSISRGEPTPHSDLEPILLIEKEEELPYFKNLTTFLELQCLSIGETPCTHAPIFTSSPPKGGFYWDVGGEAIGTPQKIAKEHLHTQIEPRSLSYTIHHLTPLHGSDSPFLEFLDLKRKILPQDKIKQKALSLLKGRQQDFFAHRKKLEEKREEPSLKRDYMEPLFHLLKDLALYYGIKAQNTLDIANELPFSEESKNYLQEVISTLYSLRLKTDNPNAIDPKEREKIEFLLFEPLYHVFLSNFLPKKKEIDLFELQIKRILSTKELLKENSIKSFVKHLQALPISDQALTNYYRIVSNHVDPIEDLREIFLNDQKSSLIKILEKIPNHFGQRLILPRKRNTFLNNLAKIVSAEKSQGKKVPYTVEITSPFFQGGYLLPKVIDKLFDTDGNIKKEAEGSNSRVARYRTGPLDFHFKEKPSNPKKESPFHPGREHGAAELMFRLFGRGTSISELFEFTIESPAKDPKKYLVLISETIQGKSPHPENPPEIDPIQLSELFLSLPLLLPGDMRPVNLIHTPEKELISIDNDVSWIKPYTKEGCHLYTTLPFLYPRFTLHEKAIENFLALRPTPILMSWLEELVTYNKLILEDNRLQRYEDIPEKNFFSDPKHYTSTCRFQRGTGGQLISQFYQLQEFLKQNKHRPIKGIEILKTILSLDEECLSPVGEKIYEDYEKIQKKEGIKTADQVKVVTRRRNTESMSMTKSEGSFFENIPESVKELENYTPEHAYKEIEKLSAIHFEGFFGTGELATLENGKGMQGIDEITQKYLFKAFLLHTFEHLNLSHSILRDEELELFLEKSGKTLKVIDLRHCPNLTEKTITTIVDRSKALEKLYLSHCAGIKNFAYATQGFFGTISYQKAHLPHLKVLHLGDCKALESIQIDAPNLAFLKANDNPALKSYDLGSTSLKANIESTGSIPLVPCFGKRHWEKYFGEVGVEPPLPSNIREILQSPCIFWRDKKVYETHLLVFIPAMVNGKPFHLDALEELIKSPKTGHQTKYHYYDSDVKKELGTKSTRSHWALMTRDVLPNSRSKKYEDQKGLVANHAQRSGIPYELPIALDAATAILMEHVQTGNRLYSDEPYTYTRCQEKVYGNQWLVAIGAFGAGGLSVNFNFDWERGNLGVGALRRFR